jgi:hypothetical protein
MSPRASFEAAQLYRSPEGVPIALAFSFMSALYFRGKIAYARAFAEAEDIHVIAPGFGFVPPHWAITPERMKILQRTAVDARRRSYRQPLERDARALAAKIDDDAQVILLGSVASGKYVDILLPIFRERLKFPAAFAGLGDMSRGGLMLRAARARTELQYVSLDTPRHADGAVERARELMREMSS